MVLEFGGAENQKISNSLKAILCMKSKVREQGFKKMPTFSADVKPNSQE